MIQTRRINDNITLSYIPMEKLKTTTAGVYIHRPLCEEEAAQNALLSMVLRRGSQEFPDMEALSKRLDELYGSRLSAGVSKKGEDHIISFETECISDKYVPDGEKLLDAVLRLACGVVFKPRVENGAFCSEFFVREKKNLIDRIRAQMNDKRVYAHERLCSILCKNTPYAVPRLGYEKDVNRLDEKKLYNYYKEMICSSVIDIYIAGEADIDAAADTVSKCVEGLEFKKAELPECSILAPEADRCEKVTDKMDVTQGKLAMGFTTGVAPQDGDYWAMVVANSIFGGGAHSKLFNNVREKLSLAYYAGSQLHKFKGVIAVNAGVEFKNFQKAYDETLLQLDELKSGKVSAQEFEASKLCIINSLKTYYDDQLYMQSFYLGEKVSKTNLSIEDYIEKISAVTMEEAVAAAGKIHFECAYFLTGKEE